MDFFPPLLLPRESSWVIPSTPLLPPSPVTRFSPELAFNIPSSPLTPRYADVCRDPHALRLGLWHAATGSSDRSADGNIVRPVLCLPLPKPHGCLTYIVGVYVAIIGFMGWRAMAGLQLVGAAWRWTELAAGTGALLFIVSDLTIALDKFCFPVPYSRALIMSTYYAAQMLIALSAVESREPVEDYRLSKAK